jgi:hypothetical protein
MKLLATLARLSLCLLLTVSLAWAQFPSPDVALSFDGADSAWSNTNTQVTDISGNDNHGYWTTFFADVPDSAKYAHYTNDGRFGDAWHISGYHACCSDMASSSADMILLAGNMQPRDVPGFQTESPVFHQGFQSLSVAFWFRSDRDYSETVRTPCPPLANGMHEQEILFDLGSEGNGLTIQNFLGYISVKMAVKDEGVDAVTKKIDLAAVDNGTNLVDTAWSHIAVTYDGNTGELTLYLDGQVASSFRNDPNPQMTGLGGINPAPGFSAEIGTQNNTGLFGSPGDGFWNQGLAVDGRFCLRPQDSTKYRSGWPASGDFDDFIFYKDAVLSQAQIQQLASSSISALLTGQTRVPSIAEPRFRLYPNPARSQVVVRHQSLGRFEVTLYDVTGREALRQLMNNRDRLDVSGLPAGIYTVRIGDEVAQKLVVQ